MEAIAREDEQVVQDAPSPKPLVQRARKLLNRRLRVGVKDGRVFLGKFHCVDKQGNIILYDTVEQGQGYGDGDPEQRQLGLVLIPARHQTFCQVEVSLHQQICLLNIQG